MTDLQGARDNSCVDASKHLTAMVVAQPEPLPAIVSAIPAVIPEPPPERYAYTSRRDPRSQGERS